MSFQTLENKLRAKQLWAESMPAVDSLVEVYLASRGLNLSFGNVLRFLPDHPHRMSGTRWPVMLAAITDIYGELHAVHRTYLDKDGRKKAPVQPAKMTLGPIGHCGIHLAPAAEKLALAEGIETALSVMQVTGIPTWSTISAGGLQKIILPLPPLCSDIIIAADADVVGLNAAHEVAQRFIEEGRQVRIAVPPPGAGKDFNDALRVEMQ